MKIFCPDLRVTTIWSGLLHFVFFAFCFFQDSFFHKEAAEAPIEVTLQTETPPPPPAPVAEVVQQQPEVQMTPPLPEPAIAEQTPTEREQSKEQKLVEQEIIKPSIKPPEKAQVISQKNQTVEKQTLAAKRGEFKNSQKEEGIRSPSMDGEIPVAVSESSSAGSEGSQTLDYIDEIDPGLETLLNTKENIFFEYYVGLRKKVNTVWHPVVQKKLQRRVEHGFDVTEARDQVTRCLVTLNRSGELVRIQVIGRSSIPELDEAAVEAFRKAGPFQKPPQEMADAQGRILIRWDFIIDS